MSLAAAKAAARTAAFARRKAAFAARGAGDAEILRRVLAGYAGRRLAGYMPMRTEIDPLPAMAAHAGPVAVPVIEGPGRPLRFRSWTADARMMPGTFGALVPEAGDWIEPQVLIVPLLAFDRRGFRLGYGGGFYDRTLEGLRAAGPVIVIGFAFAAQEVAAVPVEPTDQRLDLIVTETATIRPDRAG
ncbi:MAG: 5-formyltetrahydrofolate cyclo-ligase [Alphaproteobacteria bacterium HGW-Alphaproteobacteria-6]|nr:MAG: 5-formyltetrahydrofolate cyclo-ligase [Alphaproteobacteria bacterium HGW-Alphaproteobacteria-6]